MVRRAEELPMQCLRKRELPHTTMADTAPARMRSVNEGNAVYLIAIHTCAKAGMEETILVVITGAQIRRDFYQNWHFQEVRIDAYQVIDVISDV